MEVIRVNKYVRGICHVVARSAGDPSQSIQPGGNKQLTSTGSVK